MKGLNLGRYALCSCVAAAMLAGCGGSQLPIATPGSAQTGTPSGESLEPLSNGGYKSLYSFQGIMNSATDGEAPAANLIDVNGTLYGTTVDGGLPCSLGIAGCGTVFAITPSGSERVLYRFNSQPDGAWPHAGLIYVNGAFYGTTGAGGTYNNGTFFTVTPSGSEQVLHSFGGANDGLNPGELTNVKGTLYGVTVGGGTHGSNGTVFRITTTGKESVIYSFGGGPYDGSAPVGPLVDLKGTLYGVTSGGGAYRGSGTVFKVTTSGKEHVLYNFKGKLKGDGEGPDAGLTDVSGVLYGTTRIGGSTNCNGNKITSGCGTVFSVTTSGVEKVLHRFEQSDGLTPEAPLTARNGSLYGTTYAGGSGECSPYGCGTVFAVTTSGAESVLYSFNGKSDGQSPIGGLTMLNGKLYGTTSIGGLPCGCGTVFRLLP